MRFCQIQHNFMCNDKFCKQDQKYLNVVVCKFYTFLRENFENLTSHIHLSPNNLVTELLSLKNSPFLATLYIA